MRSTATQAITFECVKWRRPPRTSQMPSSGRCQAVSMNAISSLAARHPSGVSDSPSFFAA